MNKHIEGSACATCDDWSAGRRQYVADDILSIAQLMTEATLIWRALSAAARLAILGTGKYGLSSRSRPNEKWHRNCSMRIVHQGRLSMHYRHDTGSQQKSSLDKQIHADDTPFIRRGSGRRCRDERWRGKWSGRAAVMRYQAIAKQTCAVYIKKITTFIENRRLHLKLRSPRFVL